MDRYDVLVVGAGPAGAAAARALRLAGGRVALVGRPRRDGLTVGETLSGRARESLRALGLWDAFLAQGHRESAGNRTAWGGAGPDERSSMLSPYGPDFHLTRRVFDAWLVESAVEAGATFIEDDRLAVSQRDDGWFQVAGAALQARFAVDGTGRFAALSRRLGARRLSPQPMTSVTGWFECPRAEPVILLEATRDGWWYSAPLPSGIAVAAWITDARSTTVKAVRDDAIWQACLTQAPLVQARLRGAAAVAPRAARACGPELTVIENPGAWLPVGDAAASLDPLGGQGLCFALESAIAASRVIAAGADVAARGRYLSAVTERWQDHLTKRAAYYEMERRFPGSAFWRRGAEAISFATPPPRAASGPARRSS